MYQYCSEFMDAIDFSKELGLEVPDFEFSNKRFLDEKIRELSGSLLSTLELPLEEKAGQCFKISFKIKPEMEKILKTKAFLTFEWVRTPLRDYFRIENDEIRKMILNREPSGKKGLHCWLTLASGEIIDATLSATLAYVQGGEESDGGVIARHWKNLKEGVEFHPQIVGDDFLTKSGIAQIIQK